MSDIDHIQMRIYMQKVKSGMMKLEDVPQPYRNFIGSVLYGKEIYEPKNHSSISQKITETVDSAGEAIGNITDWAAGYAKSYIDLGQSCLKWIANKLRKNG